MSRRASWAEHNSTSAGVWIIDLDSGPSVTNDAEQVVADLHARYGDRRYFYRDTMGKWDELLHHGPRFTGFAPSALTLSEETS